jgi:predicted membrane protein
MKNGNDNTKRYKYHRRSYFGPILLIVIGLVFLGMNLGIIPEEGWSTLWRLWPVLLIIGGLDDLFRREGIAWPILMITAGCALLYNYFGPSTWISWAQFIQLWPILLIAAGIDVMFRGQSGWKSILGVVLTVILIGGAVFFAFQGERIQADYLKIEEEMGSSVKSAELELSLAVGELILAEASRSGEFITGQVTPDTVRDEMDEKGGLVSYQLESSKPAFFPHTARWDLSVTTGIPLDIHVESSVGEILLDLDKLDLNILETNQGVGRIYVNFPAAITEEVLIKQGVGIIEIVIPEDIRIAVDAQNGLSRVKFPGDFELDDGYYSTPGTTRLNADLVIIVEQGIGLVTFQYGK